MTEPSTIRWAVGIIATVLVAMFGATTFSISGRIARIEMVVIENRTLILENKALIETRSCRCQNE